MKLKNLKSKKGFSLIELLVSFAIFGLLCVALVGFITMSSRSYRRTTDLINLQIEHQIIMKMINEYVVDCNGRIEFEAGTFTLTIVNICAVTGSENPDTFRLDGGLLLNGNLASRNTTEFDVWLERDNLLAVRMSFSPTNPHDNRRYTATQFVALRNSPDTDGVPRRQTDEG